MPQTPEELTFDWINDVLLAGGASEGRQAARFESDVIGVGLIGCVVRVRLEYESLDSGAPASLILKMPTDVPKNREIGESGDYEREIRFYLELSESLPVRIPRCYLALMDEDVPASAEKRVSNKISRKFLLALEDMAPALPGDDVLGCGFDEALSILKAIAPMHAALWESPKLDELWWAWRAADVTGDSHDAYLDARPSFDAYFGRGLSGVVFEALDWLNENGQTLQRLRDQTPSTFIHVDFRLDNIFVAQSAGGLEVTLFDWQTPGIGPAAMDVASFIGRSLHEGFSIQEEVRLMRAYYGALVDSGVMGYPFEAFQRDFSICLTLNFRTMVTNFTRVDWGEGRELERRDLHIKRVANRVSRVDLSALVR